MTINHAEFLAIMVAISVATFVVMELVTGKIIYEVCKKKGLITKQDINNKYDGQIADVRDSGMAKVFKAITIATINNSAFWHSFWASNK